MAFDLIPSDLVILYGKHNLSGHLMGATPTFAGTTDDQTTFADQGWEKQGMLLKQLTYQIEGFAEGGAGNIEKQLADLLGDASAVSVLKKNVAGNPADMFKVRASAYSVNPDPSTWTKFQIGHAPDKYGFRPGLTAMAHTVYAGTSTNVNNGNVDLGQEYPDGGTFFAHITDAQAGANLEIDIRTDISSAGGFGPSDSLWSGVTNPLAPAGGYDAPTFQQVDFTTDTVHRYVRVRVTSDVRPWAVAVTFAPA